MHKTTVYLDEQIYLKIRRLAEATGRTQAMIIREALAEYQGSSKRKRPSSIGAGASGTADLSDRAEELLEGFGEDR
jgi:predicted transcriptional regulator